MDVVVIFNGLGNQMSQYAFYLAKKRTSPRTIAVFVPGSNFSHSSLDISSVFGIRLPGTIVTRLMMLFYNSLRYNKRKFIVKLFRLRLINEPNNYDYSEDFLYPGPRGINFYCGGWHSERYFKSLEDKLNNLYRFPLDNDEDFIRWKERIQGAADSVSLHVRRGDYVNISPDDYYQFGGVATLDFYKKAIEHIKGAVGQCTFFVFSDDVSWCREQFGDETFFYVDCNSGNKSWRDLYLMTLCRHHINANSTFSWWGAWLNADSEGVVIRPNWFIRGVETKDFYPQGWMMVN